MVALVNSSILLEPESNVSRPRLVTHDEAADLLLRARVLPAIAVDRDAARSIAQGSALLVDELPATREVALVDARGAFGILDIVDVAAEGGKHALAGRVTVARLPEVA
jgi:hypothetical protein